MSPPAAVPASHWRRNRVLYLLIAVALAPILGSYYAYYVAPPSGRSNYGALVEPQRPIPAFSATGLDGTAFDLRSLKGKWIFVMADGGACDEYCQAKLFHMRQLRTMTGKERDEIERVWFITDREPLSTMLIREYEGTFVVRADERDLRPFLALPETANASLRDHIWVVDPYGNLMLRWPRNADPKGTKSDIARVLQAASLWTRIERKD